jgi:hypothetical protein
VEPLLLICENGKMRPEETILRRREGDKEE